MENTDLEERLTELDSQRTLLINDRNVMKGYREEFEKMHDDLMLKIRQDAEDVTETETEIRRLALEDFAKNGSKDVGFGVGIRIMKKYDIFDMKAALKWGIDHKMGIKVNEPAMKELAKIQETTKSVDFDMDFIEMSEVPSATIPADISKELAKAGGSVKDGE